MMRWGIAASLCVLALVGKLLSGEPAPVESPLEPDAENIVACYEYELQTSGFLEPQELVRSCTDMLERHGKSLKARDRMRILIIRATANIAAGNKRAAREDVNDVLTIDPKNLRAATARAILMLNPSDLDKTILEFEKVLDNNPGDGECLTSLAKLRSSQGKEDQAFELALKAVEAAPDSADAHATLAAACATKHRNSQALTEINRALEIAPFDTNDDATAARYRTRAEVLIELGKPDQAIPNLLLAGLLAPAEPETLMSLYEVYGSLAKPIQMKEVARLLMKLKPDDELAMAALMLATTLNGDFDEALTLSEKFLLLHPTRVTRCAIFQIRGDYANAKKELDKALEESPNDVDTLARQCLFVAACPDAKFRDAKAAMAAAARLKELCDKDHSPALSISCYQAAALACAGQYADADEAIAKAIAVEEKPSSLETYKAMQACFKTKKPYSDVRTLSQCRRTTAEELAPDISKKVSGDGGSGEQLHVSSIDESALENTISCYEYEMQVPGLLDPNHIIPSVTVLLENKETVLTEHDRMRLLIVRANASMQTGDGRAAMADLEAALTIEPKNACASRKRAMLLMSPRDSLKVVPKLEEVLDAHPNDGECLSSLAVLYLKQGNEDKALELAKRAVAAEPESANAHNNLAAVYCIRNQPKESLAEINRALELAPFDRDPARTASGYQTRAIVLFQFGKPDQAVRNLLLASRLAPNEPGIYQALFSVYESLNKSVQAKKVAQMFLELKPDDNYAVAAMALANALNGEFDDALALSEKVLSVEKDSTVRLFRHNVFLLKQDYAKAKDELEKATRQLPDDIDILAQRSDFLASCPDPKFRDPKAAEALAMRVRELYASHKSPGLNPSYYLALAYGSDGRDAEAEKAIQSAIAVEEFPSSLERYKDMQACFKAKKPYDNPLTLDQYRRKIADELTPHANTEMEWRD